MTRLSHALPRLTLTLTLAALGCGDDDGPPATQEPQGESAATANPGAFPGHDSPPLDELIQLAKQDQNITGEPPEPYEPKTVEVPPLQNPLARGAMDLLPKDQDGTPILSRVAGAALTVDPTLSDPITAKGVCLQLLSDCHLPARVDPDRNSDSCFMSVRTCSNNRPWATNEECCPARCQELYVALRKDGMSRGDAAILTAGSDCFPAVREFIEAAAERDRQRSAP